MCRGERKTGETSVKNHNKSRSDAGFIMRQISEN